MNSTRKLHGSEEEYLSIKELAARIPLSAGTIRNKISQGEFVHGYHYFKPGGTIMFRWSRIVEWIEMDGKIAFPRARKRTVNGQRQSKQAR